MGDIMEITFILPGPGHSPVGGFKVVYEYANHLVDRGHKVSIVHPALLNRDAPFIGKLKKALRYIQRYADKSYLPKPWFRLDKRVRIIWAPSLNEIFIPAADAVVATAWRTAEWVAGYSATRGRKFYLIQHLETWNGPEERVLNTWRLPLRKIVIARWLQEISTGLGESCVYIPNGLDFRAFGIDVSPDERNPHSVSMLFHDADWKGSVDGLKALSIVKERVPDLKVTLFGVPEGGSIPAWIEYHRLPPQERLRALYNRSALFIAPSWSEGWGLPPTEAMMCGAALVATDIGGHREFAEDGVTALLVPARQPEELARRILQLMEDQPRRVMLAKTGNQYIQQFTWVRATDALEQVLVDEKAVSRKTTENVFLLHK